MINLDFLYYFVEYSKTENLSKASETLHVSQSALTRAMQKTEDYVGVPLFIRTSNRIYLSRTGKEFARRAAEYLNAEKTMIESVVAFHNSFSSVSIGSVAPGPFIKYGAILYSFFKDKTISNKIDSGKNLLSGLIGGKYDFVFLSEKAEYENVVSIFAFKEKLFASVPETHFTAKFKDGVDFSQLNGQSFLVAKELGLWESVIRRKMPDSRFLSQDMESLGELINSSTLPGFATNVASPSETANGRVNVPITDKEATLDFYLCYKKENEKKFGELINALNI